jgi:DNA-binding PadR family transcriptional regulator
MHGHQIRRRAELLDVGEWAEVRIGSLYSAIHRMEAEGLILPLRREQSGNFPARTVYEITDEGRRELSVLRQAALQGAALRADPVDVALIVSAGIGESELRSLLDARKRTIETTLVRFAGERTRLEKSGYLRPATRAVFRHWEARLEAERRWHGELGELLRGIASERTNPGSDAGDAHDAIPASPRENVREPSARKPQRRKAKARSKK